MIKLKKWIEKEWIVFKQLLKKEWIVFKQLLKKEWIVYLIPVFTFILFGILTSVGLGPLATMVSYFIAFESLITLTFIGISKLYNRRINFENDSKYNIIIASIIISVHLMAGLSILSIFFML